MFNRHRALIGPSMVCLLVMGGCAASPCAKKGACTVGVNSAATMPQVKMQLELAGSGLGKPMTFSYEQLAGLKMTSASGELDCGTGRVDDTSYWQGPSLDLLLQQAQIKPGPMTLSFEAGDGFGNRCSRKEAPGAIIALQDGQGRWLAQLNNENPLRMISPQQGAKFWIYNLCKITVEPAAGG